MLQVDEAMWTAIRQLCPFLEDNPDAMEDEAPPVEFVDEDAPPLHSQGEDHPTAAQAEPGELKAFYEEQLRAHETRRREAEQQELEQTMAFLKTDPEFAAQRVVSAPTPSPGANTLSRSHSTTSARRHGARSASHSRRPITRSKSQVDSVCAGLCC